MPWENQQQSGVCRADSLMWPCPGPDSKVGALGTPLSLGTAEAWNCARQTNISHLRGSDSVEKKGSQVLKFVPMARLQSPGQAKPGEICCHLCMPQTPW